jgi:hypothetical protein
VEKSYPVRVKKVRRGVAGATFTVRRVRIVVELDSYEWRLLRAFWREYRITPEHSAVTDHTNLFVAGLKRELGMVLARSVRVRVDDLAE